MHPGHVRHLAYAKAAGAVLVVSVMTDRYVAERNMKPWPDEDLRALCVASYEMVDFVFINTRPTPLYVIGSLQPDFYAKGFAHIADPIAEIEAVRSYGGKVI